MTEGLLERPPKHGRELRFNRDQVSRLQAIRELQRRGLSLEAIVRQLDRMPPHEWQAFSRPGHAPPLTRLLMQEPTALYERSTLHAARARRDPAYMSAESERQEVWVRVRVTPEVEIQYRAGAGARIQEALREIAEFARRRLAATPPPRAQT